MSSELTDFGQISTVHIIFGGYFDRITPHVLISILDCLTKTHFFWERKKSLKTLFCHLFMSAFDLKYPFTSLRLDLSRPCNFSDNFLSYVPYGGIKGKFFTENRIIQTTRNTYKSIQFLLLVPNMTFF